MKKCGIIVFAVMLCMGLMPVLPSKPEFASVFHRNQLIAVALVTVLSNPVASAVQAFALPGRKDIKHDSGVVARAKRAGRELAKKKSWTGPYAALWKALRSPVTRGGKTRLQMIFGEIKNHKTFSACAAALIIDLAVVSGKYIKHVKFDLPAWEKLKVADDAAAAAKKTADAAEEARLAQVAADALRADLVRQITALKVGLGDKSAVDATLALDALTAELERLKPSKAAKDAAGAEAAAKLAAETAVRVAALKAEIVTLAGELGQAVGVEGNDEGSLRNRKQQLSQLKQQREALLVQVHQLREDLKALGFKPRAERVYTIQEDLNAVVAFFKARIVQTKKQKDDAERARIAGLEATQQELARRAEIAKREEDRRAQEKAAREAKRVTLNSKLATAPAELLSDVLGGSNIPLLRVESADKLPEAGESGDHSFAIIKGRYFWRQTSNDLWIELPGKDSEANSAHKMASLASQQRKFKK